MISKSGYTCQATSLIPHEDRKWDNLYCINIGTWQVPIYFPQVMHTTQYSSTLLIPRTGKNCIQKPCAITAKWSIQLQQHTRTSLKATIYGHSYHKHSDSVLYSPTNYLLQLKVGKDCPIGNEKLH